MDTVRLVLLVIQVVAIPVLAMTCSALYRKALDACNADRRSNSLPLLPDDTLLDRRSQSFVQYDIKTSTLGPEARRSVRRFRLCVWISMSCIVLLAANLFVR